MPLKARIQDDMKAALKGGEKKRLLTIRMLLAAIKQKEVDERIELDDAQVVGVVEKQIKQRRESAAQFRAAGRDELAQKEDDEILVLKAYMPEPLTDAEIDALIASAIDDTGATSIKDMGRVMAAVKAEAAGRADMGAIGQRVKARLG